MTTTLVRRPSSVIVTREESSPVVVARNGSTAPAVTLESLGLENVDNTSDIDKPISDAVAIAIATLESDIEAGDIASRAYADDLFASIIGSAPETLNALNELAAALGNDPDFATTIAAQIGTKANDNAVVHLTGNETIAGTKTFSGVIRINTLQTGIGTNALSLPNVGSAVNYLEVRTAATGNGVRLSPVGSDAAIDLILGPKAGGAFRLTGDSGATRSMRNDVSTTRLAFYGGADAAGGAYFLLNGATDSNPGGSGRGGAKFTLKDTGEAVFLVEKYDGTTWTTLMSVNATTGVMNNIGAIQQNGSAVALASQLFSRLPGFRPVRVASTGNVNIASAPATMDGITLNANDRVLLKDQTTQTERGIYLHPGTAGQPMTRAADMPIGTPINGDEWIRVLAGGNNGGRIFFPAGNGQIGYTSFSFTDIWATTINAAITAASFYTNNIGSPSQGKAIQPVGAFGTTQFVGIQGTTTGIDPMIYPLGSDANRGLNLLGRGTEIDNVKVNGKQIATREWVLEQLALL